jgi:hypothetical protein
MQRFQPRGPGWYTPEPRKEPGGPSEPDKPDKPNKPDPTPSPWCCWLLIALGILQLILLGFLVKRALSKK